MGIDDHVDNFQIMKTWIQECRQNHEMCVKNLENFLPTRLLVLQAFETGHDIRLVSVELKDFEDEDFQPEYITLSHCWGPPEKHPITTTKENLEERMTRISIDDLSNTFRDAVRITRELDERYLWIDSLCIIQDDKDDWAREAALMAEVYGNSYCTLAALSSKDSTEGCRLVPNIQDTICQFLELDAEDDCYGPYRIRIFQDEPREWHEEYGDNPYRHRGYGNSDNPLRSRAWTLQERELSRRNIHFGKHQLLWECRKLKASAQLSWHHKRPEDDFEMWPIRNALTESLATDGPVAMRDRWYELMEDYSFRSLTNETDKLPALSGLARHYQDVFPGGKYLAGIWHTHLPAALLWRSVYGTGHRPLSYIAPTWSWASVRGRVSYETQRTRDFGGRIEDRAQEKPLDCDFGDLKVEKMYTLPKHNDIYGAIKGAYLVLHGALLTVIDSDPHFRRFEHDSSSERKAVLTKDGATVGILYPDATDEIQYAGKLFCLSIRGEPHSSQIAVPHELYKGEEVEASELVMGLVLEEDLEIEDGYRRRGLARWVKRSLFEDSHSSSIRLI
jgi:hypothetical protein